MGSSGARRPLCGARDDQGELSEALCLGQDVRFEPVERFASPDRVFDDMWVRFTLVGDDFENCPFPVGTRVKMRLLHNFHIRDGMIAREIGYEVWLRDELAL